MSENIESAVTPQGVREHLAQRARMPWWGLTLQAVALLALFTAPMWDRLTSWSGSNQIALWVGIILLLGVEPALQWARGVKFSGRTLLAFPSSRPFGIALLVVAVVGVVATNLLMRADLLVPTMIVAVLAASVGAGILRRHNRAMLDDIRNGQVRPA